MNEAPDSTSSSIVAGDFMVVGIGASAGGLRALLELFQNTPPTMGLAWVVIVHLSPEHESRLGELLQQVTTMPVQSVTESVAIRPDHIYVISPKSQLRMHDGRLEPVEVAKRRGAAMTIDVFLETLADAHKHRGVGLILSGTGSDGTLGVRRVKAQGGITMAQLPEEAEYDSMPRNAIASGVVDFVLPVREIPGKLAVLWRNARAMRMPALAERPAPEDVAAEADEAVHDILAMLRARTRHDFSQYRRTTLMRRIERRLQVNALRELTAYRDFVREHPGEAQALLQDLLISVTGFFRDPAAWEVMEQRVVPALVESREGGDIRVWVVGCATGEEAYSLAMLFQERVEAMGRPPAVTIFATDIDERALAFARAGLYPETIAEQMSPERLHRFFTKEQDRYRIQKALRDTVMFAVHNAIQDPPFSRLDLVSCRNLLIYVTRRVQAKVLDLAHFALKPGGYLLLGMSESIEEGHDGFAILDKSSRIFVQQPRAGRGLVLPSLSAVRPPRSHANDVASSARDRLLSAGDLHLRLLEHYAPPSVVVDDRFEIVHMSDRAGHFLQFGGGEPSVNLLKSLPESLRYEVRASLGQAMHSMRTVARNDVEITRGPQQTRIDLRIHPVRDQASGRMFALVIFDEEAAERRAGPHASTASPVPAAPDTEGLEARLRDMEAQLRAAVQDHELQNEALNATNEELQATNEELRAATEELETGKEELQSINEELTTVNQELKNKIDETTRISDDLQNFITATEIVSLFVDREQRLMRYTPYAREIFNVIPADIGRPLLHVTHRLQGIDLGAEIARVFETLHTVEREAKSTDGRWFIVRFLPYRTTDDRIRGAVLTFLDITQRKAAEAAGRRNEAWAKLVVESVRDYAIFTADPAGVIQTWNAGGRAIFGYEDNEIVGKHASVLFTPEERQAGVFDDEMRRARETGRAEAESWRLRKDGSRFFASSVMAPLEEGGRHGYVKVLRDLTEQRLAQQRQQDLLVAERGSRAVAEQANRTKDDFLAVLSHELRNPLAVMSMQAEALLRAPQGETSSRVRQAAQVIHEMARAQAQLVEDLLDVSRARTGKLTINRQLLPLTFVIADSIGALRSDAKQKAITLDVEIGEAPLIVDADPVRVKQIAWNLVANAIKFTPAKGRVAVKLARDGDMARMDVEDNGQGIEPRFVPALFDWFRQADEGTTRRQGGMGIGLALVKQLVELHGGRVEAFSEGLGKGARFSVWLPLQQPQKSEPAQSAPAGGADGRLDGMRLLVVDDVEANASTMGQLLEIIGARVAIAVTPTQAIDIAKTERFDVLISDIAMPGMDGYRLLEKIRATPPNADTPAIAYSGYSGDEIEEQARAAGFDRVLTKPVGLDRLVDTLQTLRNRRPAAQ